MSLHLQRFMDYIWSLQIYNQLSVAEVKIQLPWMMCPVSSLPVLDGIFPP